RPPLGSSGARLSKRSCSRLGAERKCVIAPWGSDWRRRGGRGGGGPAGACVGRGGGAWRTGFSGSPALEAAAPSSPPAPPPPPTPPPRARRTARSQRDKVKSFEVASLGDREQHRMVRSLTEALDDANPGAGVGSRLAADVLEHRVGHVMRARERQEAAAALQQPERAQVDLLVAARRRIERRAAARER